MTYEFDVISNLLLILFNLIYKEDIYKEVINLILTKLQFIGFYDVLMIFFLSLIAK